MRRLNTNQITQIRKLRSRGNSDRDISKILNLSKSTIYYHTKDVQLSKEQHRILLARGLIKLRKTLPKQVFEEASRRGGQNAPHKFPLRYTREFLLNEIKNFYQLNGRIPTKREFNSRWQCYLRHFGSWNNAIILAGFKTNPKLFAKKWVAKDGHHCDSLSEKIIDDVLSKNEIYHERKVFYPNQKKFTVDFLINKKVWLEFVGLKGELKSYDRLLKRKRNLAKKSGIKVFEIDGKDLFPIVKLKEKLINILVGEDKTI